MAIKIMILCFSLMASLFLLPCQASEEGASGNGIKGMFVFGSSIVDNGNNNFLKARAKANYIPYGIDFPGGPSGRFSNGKNMIDVLAEHLQLPEGGGSIPPSADPSTNGPRIIHGVNFASGGSGILDSTSSYVGNVLSLNAQIENFENVILPELEAQLGSKPSDSLPKYLFVFGVGGNDYTYNYFLPNFETNVLDEAFASNLINSLSQHIKKLYSLGGRKFVVMSIYPIGCTPMAKNFRPLQEGCLEELNQAVQIFNVQLKSMVDVLKQELPGSSFVYINQNKIIGDLVQDPASHGFKEVRKACCDESSVFGGGIACRRNGKVCKDRNEYVYFDGLHVTEVVNVQIADKAFASTSQDEVYPFNVSQLAKL